MTAPSYPNRINDPSWGKTEGTNSKRTVATSFQASRPSPDWQSLVHHLDKVKVVGNTLVYQASPNTKYVGVLSQELAEPKGVSNVQASIPDPITATKATENDQIHQGGSLGRLYGINPARAIEYDTSAVCSSYTGDSSLTLKASNRPDLKSSNEYLLHRHFNESPPTMPGGRHYSNARWPKKNDSGPNVGRASKWATPAELKGGWGEPGNGIGDTWDTPFGAQAEHTLADWTGDWGPGPESWENRDVHEDHLGNDRISNWLRTCINIDHAVTIGFCEVTGTLEVARCIKGDIAPRNWVPSEVEGVKADVWYTKKMPLDLESVDATEQQLVAPWWHTYISQHSENLRGVEVPDAYLDKLDNEMGIAMQQTSEHSCLSTQNKFLKKSANERKAKAHQGWVPKEEYVLSMNKYAPAISLYLRPAGVDDMPQVREIWNHYIEKTIFCPENKPLTIPQMQTRWRDVTQCHLPFIVAVDTSSKSWRRHGMKNEPIIGFAFADDYNDEKGMYRYTVEIDMYVKPDMLQKGVGRCLLDKVMSILDSCYSMNGGYEFKSDDLKYAPGGGRMVGSIVIYIPYDSKDKSRAMWMQEWLSNYDFEQAGELLDVGEKLSTIVSQMILIKKTINTVPALRR